MDPLQSYLSYVAAGLPAPAIGQPPLSVVVDLLALVLALASVRARPFAPVGARRLAWLAVFLAGLASLVMSLGPWVSTLTTVPTGLWATIALGALLLALLVLGAATGRLTRSGVKRPFAALLELLGLLAVAAGLAGVTLPALTSAGWINTASVGVPPLPPGGLAWGLALAGAVLVLAANATGGAASVVPAGRRAVMVLAATAYAVVVVGVTFAPDWVAGTGVWSQFVLAVHVADALALLGLAVATRHMLNRPTASQYWARSGSIPAPARRTRARALSAPKPAHLAPAVATGRKREPAPAWSAMQRPLVPPSALAPFTPPSLRRTVVYGNDVSATVQTVQSFAANDRLVGEPAKGPLAPPPEPQADAPPASNAVPEGERAATLGENRAPDVPFSPQFVEAVLVLQSEMLRAGKHYTFAELAELFTEVAPRAGAPSPKALGRVDPADLSQVNLIAPPQADD